MGVTQFNENFFNDTKYHEHYDGFDYRRVGLVLAVDVTGGGFFRCRSVLMFHQVLIGLLQG